MHDARTKKEQNCFPFDTHYFGRDKFDDFDNLDNYVLKNLFGAEGHLIFLYTNTFFVDGRWKNGTGIFCREISLAGFFPIGNFNLESI